MSYRQPPPPQQPAWRRYAEEQSWAPMQEARRSTRHPYANDEDDDTRFEDEEEAYYISCSSSAFSPAKIFRGLISITLMFPCAIISTMSIGDQISKTPNGTGTLFSLPVWYTIIGAVAYIIISASGLFPAALSYIYVLGHELTHAVAALLCLGRVHSIHVSPDGGYVKVNKDNLFITLSPYFIPFWAIIWGLIWGLGTLIWPDLLSLIFLYTGLGFWLFFHFARTLWALKQEQPDLLQQGTLFSLLLIYISNILVILATLRLFGIVSIRSFLADSYTNAQTLVALISDIWQWGVALFA